MASTCNIVDPSIPPADGSCPFFGKLPQEMRNEIFKLAYTEPDGKEIRIISKTRWLWQRKTMYLGWWFLDDPVDSTEIPDFQKHMLTALSVSKEWQEQVLEIFLQETTISFECLVELGVFLHDNPIAVKYLTSLHIDLVIHDDSLEAHFDHELVAVGSETELRQGIFDLLASCPRLSDVNVSAINKFYGISKSMIVELKKLRGLRSFCLRYAFRSASGEIDERPDKSHLLGQIEEIRQKVLKKE